MSSSKSSISKPKRGIALGSRLHCYVRRGRKDKGGIWGICKELHLLLEYRIGGEGGIEQVGEREQGKGKGKRQERRGGGIRGKNTKATQRESNPPARTHHSVRASARAVWGPFNVRNP